MLWYHFNTIHTGTSRLSWIHDKNNKNNKDNSSQKNKNKQSSTMLRIFFPTIFVVLTLLHTAQCEIRAFNLLLKPASEYIHFVEGFLLSPGYIDLGELRFWARQLDLDDARLPQHDGAEDEKKEMVQKEKGEAPNQESPKSEGGGLRRQLNTTSHSRTKESVVDVAVFLLPSACATSKRGCDWPKLGIGRRTEDGTVRYCCSEDAVHLGLCQMTQLGHLIIDNDNFVGNHRQVFIPGDGDYDGTLNYGRFEEKSGSGKYIVTFSNCNDKGREVVVEGTTVWKSRHGYLPGDMFGLMYFDAILFLLYFVVLMWYGIAMKMYEDANIQIQNWIIATISMGCLELFFKAGDLFLWNEDGSRFFLAFYVGVIMGVLKRGISRCLIVMVALGWGVVRDDLGPVLNRIRFLGGLYITTSLVCDLFAVVAYTEVQKINQEEEVEFVDIVTILRLAILLIDVLFYVWIIDSLNASMEYLESMGQTTKLQQYLRLRCLLFFSILFAAMTTVFGAVNDFGEGIVDNEEGWVVGAFAEANYLFVLMTVAILWKPSPNAKEYAYVMELATGDHGSGDDDEGIIEMKGGAVPSAVDSDDDEYVDDVEHEISFEDETDDDDDDLKLTE